MLDRSAKLAEPATHGSPTSRRRSCAAGRLAIVVIAIAYIAIAGIATACATGRRTTTSTSAGDISAISDSSSAGGGLAASQLISALRGAVPQLSPRQTAIGAGALLGVAEAKLPPNLVAQLEAALPGSHALVGAARSVGLPPSSQLANANIATVSPILTSAGVPSQAMAQLPTALGSIISAQGGPDLATAFLNALH